MAFSCTEDTFEGKADKIQTSFRPWSVSISGANLAVYAVPNMRAYLITAPVRVRCNDWEFDIMSSYEESKSMGSPRVAIAQLISSNIEEAGMVVLAGSSVSLLLCLLCR